MNRAFFWKSALFAMAALPIWAAPAGWTADFSRKLEITSPSSCKLMLRRKILGSVQVMQVTDKDPVVAHLDDLGDSVEISRAGGGTWLVGFVGQNEGRSSKSRLDLVYDLELELIDASGKLKVPFEVRGTGYDPIMKVKMGHKNYEGRLVAPGKVTFIKAPFSIVEKTKDQDVLIKVSE